MCLPLHFLLNKYEWRNRFPACTPSIRHVFQHVGDHSDRVTFHIAHARPLSPSDGVRGTHACIEGLTCEATQIYIYSFMCLHLSIIFVCVRVVRTIWEE